jgi:hypothetical protein
MGSARVSCAAFGVPPNAWPFRFKIQNSTFKITSVPSVLSCSKMHLFMSITAYYRLMTPIRTFFPKEKDCLFLVAPKADWRRSTQINLYHVPRGSAAKLIQKQTKSRPKQTKK